MAEGGYEDGSSSSNPYFSRLEVGDKNNQFRDIWDSEELLFLASCAVRSESNWVSISRQMKELDKKSRPRLWFTPKNCALQYQLLLKKIEEDSGKNILKNTYAEGDTPGNILVKYLTEKRLKDIEIFQQETKDSGSVLHSYIEALQNDDNIYDDNIDELIKEIEKSELLEEDNFNQYVSKRDNLIRTKKLNRRKVTKGKVPDPKRKMSSSDDLLDYLPLSKESLTNKMMKESRDHEVKSGVKKSPARRSPATS